MKIGVVGIGKMGAAIASRLMGLGHEVTVWNRTAARAEPLLALGAKRGGLLVAVVVLPLFAPPVIFGAAALDTVRAGQSSLMALALLAAYAAAAVALSPLAMAAACRNALD